MGTLRVNAERKAREATQEADQQEKLRLAAEKALEEA